MALEKFHGILQGEPITMGKSGNDSNITILQHPFPLHLGTLILPCFGLWDPARHDPTTTVLLTLSKCSVSVFPPVFIRFLACDYPPVVMQPI